MLGVLKAIFFQHKIKSLLLLAVLITGGYLTFDAFRFPSLDSCIEKSDYECVVRRAYRDLVAPANYSDPRGWIFGASIDNANNSIGRTLAFIGETELAENIFHSQKDFFDKGKLGGAIIGRLAFENNKSELRRFLNSLSSPSVYALTFKEAERYLNRVPAKNSAEARNIFVEILKQRIANEGSEPFISIETIDHYNKGNNKRVPFTMMPHFIFQPAHIEWSLPLARKIKNPQLQKRVRRIIPYSFVYTDKFDEELQNYVDRHRKHKKEYGKRRAVSKETLALFKPPSESAAKKLSNLEYSETEHRFKFLKSKTEYFATPMDIAEKIASRRNFISTEVSTALEIKLTAIEDNSCRVEGLLGLSKAHIRRGDLERAKQLLSKTMELDPKYSDNDEHACHAAGRLFALTLKSLLGDESAMKQLASEFREISENGGFSAYLAAYDHTQYSAPFRGTEKYISQENRIKTSNGLLKLANDAYENSNGSVEMSMLIFMMRVDDRALWMRIARKVLRQSKAHRSIKRIKLSILSYLSEVGMVGDYR